MIKVEIAGEVPEIERVVRFEFRRNRSSSKIDDKMEAFLVGQATGSFDNPVYPIKVDGRTKTVRVRKYAVEQLGFTLVVE